MFEDDVRAFWVAAAGRGEIRAEAPARRTPSEDVVVRTLFSGISRGTEALVFKGQVPVSEYGRMRAPFQQGDFPAPVKYGYSSVGIVEEGPQDLVGRRVFVLFPHQTRYAVPFDAVSPLPEEVPAERAVLAANLETAINGVWDACPRLGDRIAVVGGGTVGCLVAWLAAGLRGGAVELVDVNPARAAIASTLGVNFATAANASREADVVIHASGSPQGLVLAMSLAATESTVVDMSWYGNQVVPLPLGESFHSRRLTLRSSQVGGITPAQAPRWDRRRRMQLALSLLREPVLDSLITGECRFEDLPRVMAQLASKPGDTLCHRVRYV